MKFKHLLAKSAKDPKAPPTEATLVGHTERVLDSAEVFGDILLPDMERLLGEATSARQWCEAFRWAAWLHDLGKANDHFQRMARDRGFRQGVRHEALSLIAAQDLLLPWLTRRWVDYPPWFSAAILAAVSGHHLKFPDRKRRLGTEVCFLGSHPDMVAYLDVGVRRLGLDDPPTLEDYPFSLACFGGVETRVSSIRRSLDSEELRQRRVFVACLKAGLLCADTAGSAVPAEKLLPEWLRDRLAVTLTHKGLEDVVQQRLQGRSPRPFQAAVREASANTVLLTAGCGSGKTAAAYLWASERAREKRLFVCYPTTGTASEGFAGYLQDPDFEAVLIHSRARVDYCLLENMPDETESVGELRALQMEAVETWPIPAAVCTAHTVLGLLQNVRRGIYAWPSIMRAAFVFDEVHAYSPKLFRHLLEFLKTFPSVPVLLMTATLPGGRRKAIESVCSDRGGLAEVYGAPEREGAKRYSLHRVDDEGAWETAFRSVSRGEKVLWICNTVAGAIAVARRGVGAGLHVEPFHSRYRYRDRLTRQRRVVDGFQPCGDGMLAVTTQVAEVSLDLSADVLVSELAPIPSLIQRLGRLNRHEDVPLAPRPAFFLKPANGLPYAKKKDEPEYWEAIEAWLAQVADGASRSQRELADAFIRLPEQSVDDQAAFRFHWLDDPWLSEANRESLTEPGYTIEVVREEDQGARSLAEVAIPMPIPKGRAWETWASQGRYLIAPSGTINYDPVWGASYGRTELDPLVI
ncbi:MAG TPA: CRISPR-associated helicase Cas3' [bacterium]